jgi:arsenate reductase
MYVNQIKRGAEAMVKVYCYSKCTTCRKALKWLDDNKIEYELLDIKEEHPNEETLRQLHKKSGLPLKRFFNTSGQLYREMELSKKLPNMSEDEMFRLLASDGMLVKRPLLITSDKVLTGFKEETWGETLIAEINRG